MFEKPKFYGSTTVGERGQIVLPSEMRKEFGIRSGEKLVVFGSEKGHIMLMTANAMNKFIEMISEDITELRNVRKSVRGPKRAKKMKK